MKLTPPRLDDDRADVLRYGRGFCGWRSLPNPELGFAARFESRNNDASGVVPGEQLLGGRIVATGVKVSEQRRAGEASCTEVEAKVDESVELALRDLDLDEPRDRQLSGQNIFCEQGGGLRLGDGNREGLGVLDKVPIADSRKAGDITINLRAKPLRSLDELQTFSA
jgi:hypothetical protein